MTTGVAPDGEATQRCLIRRGIDGNGDRSHAGPGQRLRAAPKRLERRACRDHVGRPEQDDRRLSSQRRKRTRPAGERPGARSQAPETVRTSRWHVALKPEQGDGATSSCPADRRLEAPPSRVAPPSTIRMRVFSGTSVNTCVAPEGQLTVSFKTRSLAPRPMSSSFECCDRNPEPACTILDLAELDRSRR